MATKRFYSILVLGLVLSLVSCGKTASTASDATNNNRERSAPNVNVTAAQPRLTNSEKAAHNQASAKRELTEEQMAALPTEDIERERVAGGMTAQEMRSLGLSANPSSEEIQAARQQQAEARRPLPDNPSLEQIINKPYQAMMRTLPCADEDCPVYEIRILADYSLYYHGIENVDLLGHYLGEFPQGNPMSKIQNLAVRFRYYRFEDSYPESPTSAEKELSATVIEISMLGSIKKVTHYADGPDGLSEIEEEMLNLLEVANWTEVLEDRQ